MLVIGIDPGLTGGIALYNSEDKSLIVHDTPTITLDFVKNGKKQKRKEMDLIKTVELIKSFDCKKCYIEKVNAMPGQGVTGVWRFGENYGAYQGILTALDIEIVKIIPQRWKKYFKLSSDKDESLILARQLFINNIKDFKLKKDNGKAEASLIALYGYNNP